MNYIQAFNWIFSRLPKKKQKQLMLLFLGMLFSGCFETVALGFIAFFASTITDPSSVLTSEYMAFIKRFVSIEYINTNQGLMVVSGIIVVIFIGFKNLFKGVVTYSIARICVSVETIFGEKLLKGFLYLPYQWHINKNSADLVNAIQWRQFLGRKFFQQFMKIIQNGLISSVMLIGLLIVQPLLSFMMIVILGSVAYLLYKGIKKRIDYFSTHAKNHEIEINKESTMAIHGIKDVKVNQKEDLFIKKYNVKADPLSKIVARQNFFSVSPVLFLEFAGFLMLSLAIITMVLFFDFTLAYITGTISLLAVAAWRILPALTEILQSLTILRKSLPYILNQKAYFDIIEKHKGLSNESDEKKAKELEFKREIKFDRIAFAHEPNGKKFINNLSFSIKKGDTVGLIGSSGAGKSTIIDLIIGLLPPSEGKIMVDDQLLDQDNIGDWLAKIGYVPQTSYIYDGTIAENISFGSEHQNIDKERVYECCHMAAMVDFIDDLPDGINTSIGERGIKLSGGQQQRLSIARALYNNPEVLVFDEATSSLDTENEKAIQNTIYSFKGRQTLIIVAHRLSTLQECDWIILIDKGRVKMIDKPDIVFQAYRNKEFKYTSS